MKNLMVFIGVLCSIQIAFGQQKKIDSLKQNLHKAIQDNTKVNILQEICDYYYFRNPSEGLVYADSLIGISNRMGVLKYGNLKYRFKGQILIKEGKFDEASLEFLKSLKFTDSIEGEEEELYADYINLGNAKKYAQDFDESIDYYKKALAIVEKTGKKDRYIVVYVNLGVTEFSRENYEEAIAYTLKAIEYKDYNDNPKRYIGALTNLGTIFYEIEDCPKAIKYLEIALEESLKIDYKTRVADCLLNLGKCRIKEEKTIQQGVEEMEAALEIYQELNDVVYQIEAHSNLGDAFVLMQSNQKSIDHHQKAIQIATEIGMQDYVFGARVSLAKTFTHLDNLVEAEKEVNYILNNKDSEHLLKRQLLIAYQVKAELSEKKENYLDAYTYHKLFKNLNDSILTAEQLNNVAKLEIDYQTEKKEKENLQLKTEKAEQEKLLAIQTKRNWQLGGGLATTMLGLGIFFIAFRKNQKQKKEIELQKNKVEHLQKELHHRLKNNLAFIDVFISLAKGKYTDPAYRERLNELQNRIKSMFEIHEQLFRKEDITTVNAQNYISKLAENVKAAYANPNISVEEHIDPNAELDSQTSFPMGIIINEFITNSYKYAFDQDQQGIIKIKLNGTPEFYRLTLSDNGKGFSENFDADTINTFGLDSIKLLTQEYNGTFSLTGNEGVTLEITLPKPTTV